MQKHENKRSEIQFHGRDGICQQTLIRTENADQKFRCKNDRKPCQQCINECHDSHGNSCLFYTFVTMSTIIVADNRRRTFRDCIDWCLNHLTHAGDDCHDRNIERSAGDRKYVIAADCYQAVCQLHDKSGSSEADDIFRIF